jgi:hypothetical protein
MDSLCEKSTLKSLCQTLAKLPDGFKDTYDNALARIDKQSEEQRKLAYRVLSWISYAFHPLSLVELQHAVAIQQDMTEMDEEDLNDEIFLLSVCGGLVVLTEESKKVALVRKYIVLYLLVYSFTNRNRLHNTGISGTSPEHKTTISFTY